jgi:hypothetical protein
MKDVDQAVAAYIERVRDSFTKAPADGDISDAIGTMMKDMAAIENDPESIERSASMTRILENVATLKGIVEAAQHNAGKGEFPSLNLEALLGLISLLAHYAILDVTAAMRVYEKVGDTTDRRLLERLVQSCVSSAADEPAMSARH